MVLSAAAARPTTFHPHPQRQPEPHRRAEVRVDVVGAMLSPSRAPPCLRWSPPALVPCRAPKNRTLYPLPSPPSIPPTRLRLLYSSLHLLTSPPTPSYINSPLLLPTITLTHVYPHRVEGMPCASAQTHVSYQRGVYICSVCRPRH